MVDQLWTHLENKTDQALDKKEHKWMNATLKQVQDWPAMAVENLAEFVIETQPYFSKNPHISEGAIDMTVMNFLRG